MIQSPFFERIVQAAELTAEAKGMVEAKRSTLKALANRKFGPSEAGSKSLDAVSDQNLLDLMNLSIFDVNSWDELLAVKSSGSALRAIIPFMVYARYDSFAGCTYSILNQPNDQDKRVVV